MGGYLEGCWNCGRTPPEGQCGNCWGCPDCCADPGNVHGCAVRNAGLDEHEVMFGEGSAAYEERMRERTGNRHWPLTFVTACCRADFFEDGNRNYCASCRLQATLIQRV